MTESPDLSFYKEHPKTCDPEDFWGQVRRTLNGKPIPQEQIDMIVESVCNGLELSQNDVLLDLCCGNGALTTYFFERCKGGLGVDFSEYLIKIACQHFVRKPQEKYVLQDVVDFVESYSDTAKFTKAVCYGSLQYLPKQSAYTLLMSLRRRFVNLVSVYIGNVPDKAKMPHFFGENYIPGIEERPDSPIGIWRTKTEFILLAEETGWEASFFKMPGNFYAAHYRFDVLLLPK